MKQDSLFTSDEFKKMKGIGKKKKHEEKVQLQVCEYLKTQYPDVIFTCDLASGMNLGEIIGGMNSRMRSSRGQPDLFIATPSVGNRFGADFKYGLFIEIKKEGVELKRLKDGKKINKGDYKIRKTGDWYDLHIEEQGIILERLNRLGYKAVFGVGFEECKKIIDDYLK